MLFPFFGGICKNTQIAAEEEKQEEKGAEEGKDKAGKIKKLTAEFIKKHEELNELAEEINELEKE